MRRPSTENVLPSLVVVSGAFHGAVVDAAGIERDEIVEAAAIERQVLDLLFTDEAGDLGGSGVH